MLGLNRQNLLIRASWINGRWEASARDWVAVRSPATGDEIATVPSHGAPQARAAIAAAGKALPEWRARPAKERANILRSWFDLIMENREDLAKILTAEQGKTLSEARDEIAYGARHVEWFAEEAKRIDGDIIPPPSANKRILVLKQPVGVVAAITPWNFPNAMITRKVAPALAAGCTVVCKPAIETPRSGLALCELAREAGVPDGVFNMVVGNARDIGAEITDNPDVPKLTFTGSTPVGKMLMEQCAGDLKTSLSISILLRAWVALPYSPSAPRYSNWKIMLAWKGEITGFWPAKLSAFPISAEPPGFSSRQLLPCHARAIPLRHGSNRCQNQ